MRSPAQGHPVAEPDVPPSLNPVTRRHFLGMAGTLSFGAWCGCADPSNRARPTESIVDTHTHFYDPERAQGVPWPPQDNTFLHRRVLPAEFKQLVQPLGVTGTVVVEASPWVEDNQWVLDLAAREPFILGLVGHLKPGQPGFEKDLNRFAKNPLFRGIRTGLWGISIEPKQAAFIGDLRRLAERDLALDVLVGPNQLELVAKLAAAVPDLRMVVDHCANVRIEGGAPSDVWVAGIGTAARHGNVYMKVSGLVEGTGRRDQKAPTDLDVYRPVLDVVWDSFGEDRVIYGSNWPVSAQFGPYTTVLSIVSDYVHTKGRSAAAKYFRRNAARVYRFAS